MSCNNDHKYAICCKILTFFLIFNMGIFLRFSRYFLYQQKKTVHIPQRFNLNLLIASGLKIKKNSKWPFGDYQRKNGRQMQKCSPQIAQEQKLRLEPHLIDIVVRLLELNTLQKHPLVAAAWDSRSEQTFLKCFQMPLVGILTTILLPGNFETAANYENHSVYPSLVINNSWLSV